MPKPKVPGELPQGVFAAVGKHLKYAPDPVSPSTFKAAVPSAPRTRVDRGDGRDAGGRFTGKGGYGKNYEAAGLDRYERRTGRKVDRQQRRATGANGEGTRYYDGLVDRSDGDLDALEVKGGTASKSPEQRAFDNAVSPDSPATVSVNGQQRNIVKVIELRER